MPENARWSCGCRRQTFTTFITSSPKWLITFTPTWRSRRHWRATRRSARLDALRAIVQRGSARDPESAAARALLRRRSPATSRWAPPRPRIRATPRPAPGCGRLPHARRYPRQTTQHGGSPSVRRARASRNAKEYTLIAPDDHGAHIDPFLPLALADIAAMAWGAIVDRDFAPDRLGVRFGDTTVGKLRRTIGRRFAENCGVNLNIDLYNEKCRGRNYLQLWSEWLHAIGPWKMTCQRRVERTLKYRDGSQNEAVSRVGRGHYYAYQPEARDALIEAFDGNHGLADAHVDTAHSIANCQDWRLQFFVRMSEARPVELVDGVLTDTLHGKWHRGFFRKW